MKVGKKPSFTQKKSRKTPNKKGKHEKNTRNQGKKRPDIFAYYGSEAEAYGQSHWMARNQIHTTEHAIELLESDRFKPPLYPLEDSLVLDLGCGTGYSSHVLVEFCRNVIAVDISHDMLRQNPSHPHLNRIQSDMRYLPFRSETFDNLISISAFNFIAAIENSSLSYSQGVVKGIHELEFVLKFGARASIEFYPTALEQDAFLQTLKNSAFSGGLLIEDQDTKKEKKYLLLHKS